MALNLKNFIAQLPNNISGDGKNFVAILKKYLASLETGVLQEITDATAVTPVEQVTALSLSETHTFLNNLYPQNNIVVTFDHSNVTNYQEALVYASTNGGSSYYRAGNTTGTQCVMSNVTNGATYKIKVLAVNTAGTIASFSNAPSADITIVGASVAQSQATQLVLTWDKDGALWEWLHTPNAFTDFYELRLDDQAGTLSGNLLDRTRLLYSKANPGVRSGTAYLFVRNIFGDYSVAATHSFSKAVENQPAVPTLTQLLNGIRIDMDAVPATANGVHLHLTINGTDTEEFDIASNVFTYFRLTGTVVAKYCFTDDIGYGAYSETTTIVLKSQLVSSDIADGAIVADKIAANAVTAAKILANAVEADKIKAGAITADKIAAEAVTADKIQADAITGDKILAGSIIGDHISAGAISTDKLAAGSIALAGELKIVGGAVTLDENGLLVTETDGRKTVFDGNGITFKTASGIASGAVRKVVSGTANDGSFIQFTEAWKSAPFVIVAPREAQTTVAGYSNSSVKTVCEAYSNDAVNDPQMLTGFRVKMKSYLIAGTGGGSSLSGYDIDADGTISPNSPAATTQLTATITVNLGSYVASHEEVDNTIIHRAYTDIDPGAGWFADRNNYIIGAISFTNGRYFTQAGALQETKSGTAWTLNDNNNGMTHNMATTDSHTHMFYDAYYNPATDSLKNLYFNRSFTHRHVKTVAAVSTSGSVTIALYYKLSTDTDWTYAKSVTYNNTPSSTPTNQSYTVTVATSLTPGVYEVKAVLTASSNKNLCQLTAFGADSTGSELDNTSGTVNFLAIETDQNNYYTIE